LLEASAFRWVALKKIRWSDPTGKEVGCGKPQKEQQEALQDWMVSTKPFHPDAREYQVVFNSCRNLGPSAFRVRRISAIHHNYRTISPGCGKIRCWQVFLRLQLLCPRLVDDGETAEQTAIRELEEETGFKAHKVIDMSPLLVSDPGMTNATMKLAIVDVPFPHHLEMPRQKLDPGEFITARIGFVIDARLSHIASGFSLSESLQQKTL
ncbi:putative Nudix hydrolase P35G2.12, partial [Grifola frondosa]